MSNAAVDNLLGRDRRSRRGGLVKWGVIGVAVVLAAVLAAAWFSPPRQPTYATSPITRGDLDVTISATGNLAPTKQVNVGSEESGLVQKVFVGNNDRVREGQPLASLDLSRLRDALVESQASLQAALAAVQVDQATVAQTRATLERDEQVAKLSGGKVPSLTELDTAKAEYARAVANVASAKAQVAQAQAQVSTNQTSLQKGTIYAPVTGVVLSRQVEPGQTVAAQFNVATLFTIAEDLSRMKLEVKVDEADIGELHEGAPATFTVDAYPGRTFPATVTRVDLGANATPQVNSAGASVAATSNVVAYTAVLSVSNPDLLLKPGMTATASILAARHKGVLLAPNAALRFNPTQGVAKPGGIGFMAPPPRARTAQSTIGRGSEQTIWVLGADHKPASVPVTTGDTDGTDTEVTGPGLRPGLNAIIGKLAKAPR